MAGKSTSSRRALKSGGEDPRIEEPGQEELRGRVMFSLLRPTILLARLFGLPLRDVRKWFELAYFRELRRDRLSARQASDVLDVSVRKVAELSAELKRNFFDPERTEGLPRRIEFMLSNGPMTEGRLKQALPEDAAGDVHQALDLLVAEQRIARLDGRTVTYTAMSKETRLVRPGWRARIDGLNQLMSTVTNVVAGRFFRNDATAFVRTSQLRVRERDLIQLNDLYDKQIWPLLKALDAAAEGDPEAVPLSVSILWGPEGSIERELTGQQTED